MSDVIKNVSSLIGKRLKGYELKGRAKKKISDYKNQPEVSAAMEAKTRCLNEGLDLENIQALPLDSVTQVFKVDEDKVDDKIQELGFKIKKTTKLGKGAFGIVREAVKLKDDEDCAVKIMTLIDDKKREKHLLGFKNELVTLKKLKDNIHIIQIFGDAMINDQLFIFMERADGKSLSDEVRHKGPLDEKKARRWFYQMCLAINFMHFKGITHRDIKLNNVLLKKPNEEQVDSKETLHRICKVSDFGLSRVLFAKDKDEGFKKLTLADNYCGTDPYMAPEIVRIALGQRKPFDPTAADIWALGVCLYCMITKAYPFFSNDKQETLKAMRDSNFKFPRRVRKKLSPQVKDLVHQMLEPNTQKRITFRAIFSHEWVQTFEYNHKEYDPKKYTSKKKKRSSDSDQNIETANIRLPSSKSPKGRKWRMRV